MVTLRCTRRLLKYLDIAPDETPNPPTGALGDWYANLVPTVAGNLIIFVNERTLLTVAIPEWEVGNLVPLFRDRVFNLLVTIGISVEAAIREVSHLEPVQFGKTASRSVVGSMNDIAWQYQVMAEAGRKGGSLSLSEAEEELSRMPCKPLGYRYPSDIARELLRGGTGSVA
jgi:hypothetical protein